MSNGEGYDQNQAAPPECHTPQDRDAISSTQAMTGQVPGPGHDGFDQAMDFATNPL
jgi:hypothetical protein